VILEWFESFDAECDFPSQVKSQAALGIATLRRRQMLLPVA